MEKKLGVVASRSLSLKTKGYTKRALLFAPITKKMPSQAHPAIYQSNRGKRWNIHEGGVERVSALVMLFQQE